VPDRERLVGSVAVALKSGGGFALVNWHPRLREQTTVLGEPRGPKTELRIGPNVVKRDVGAAGLHLLLFWKSRRATMRQRQR
jgi:hypothetical protein